MVNVLNNFSLSYIPEYGRVSEWPRQSVRFYCFADAKSILSLNFSSPQKYKFSGSPIHSTTLIMVDMLKQSIVIIHSWIWKGVRVVECARLESGCASSTAGSNPVPSANICPTTKFNGWAFLCDLMKIVFDECVKIVYNQKVKGLIYGK